jgi:hypothetical protein
MGVVGRPRRVGRISLGSSLISLVVWYLGHDGLVILNIVHVVAHPSLSGMRCGPLITVVVHKRRGNSMLLLLLLDVMLVV